MCFRDLIIVDMLSPIVHSPLNMFVELGSMALCINLLLGQKHLLLYWILSLQDMFFEKMHFVMTRYYLTICFMTPPIPPLVNMIIDVNMSLCKIPFIYVSMYELSLFGLYVYKPASLVSSKFSSHIYTTVPEILFLFC